MNKVLIMLFLALMTSMSVSAQLHVAENTDLHTQVSKEIEVKIIDALNTLFQHVHSGLPVSAEINQVAFDQSFFERFKTMDTDTTLGNLNLVNLYPVTGSQYLISMAFINHSSLRRIVNLVACTQGDAIIFSSPLWYYTRNWKTTKVGNVTYFYPDSININRAKKFDKTNSRIAHNLGLQPEQLNFYLCNNYQDALHLMGYEYDRESAGNFRDGYGIDTGTIFSIMHNEDFSHDTFHYYSWKFRKHERNSAADEGVAYSWGNAYYTDEHGEMITAKQLIPQLKIYLQQHQEITLLQLFEQNPPIFGYMGKVRSLLSSLICDEIERQKGVNGIKALIDCDKGDANYFRVTNDLIGINRNNFDDRVNDLLKKATD